MKRWITLEGILSCYKSDGWTGLYKYLTPEIRIIGDDNRVHAILDLFDLQKKEEAEKLLKQYLDEQSRQDLS